jgi:uncharacterized protein YndB with AHSA1/START domain
MPEFAGEAATYVEAPPERCYALVTDIARMGEWSPETVRAQWLDGATEPAVGARFRGTNKEGIFRWSTTPEVLAAEPAREFAFRTKETVWRYRFEPEGAGTRITESFEVEHYPWVLRLLFPPNRRQPQMVADMRTTLERIKAAAEATA